MNSVLFPLLAASMIPGVLLLVVNNLQHNRKFHETPISRIGQLSPADRRRIVIGLGLMGGCYLVVASYTGITAAFEGLASWAGWCPEEAPGADLWPPAVVFTLFALASWLAWAVGGLREPWLSAAHTSGWAFLSLAVGFLVAVFWSHPAVLVWPPVVAALLPVAWTLVRKVSTATSQTSAPATETEQKP